MKKKNNLSYFSSFGIDNIQNKNDYKKKRSFSLTQDEQTIKGKHQVEIKFIIYFCVYWVFADL
jgi:hypothetical protein